MSIEPLKYMIQPVAIERDDTTGRIVKEMPGQVITVHNAEDAARAVTEFEIALKQMEAANAGGTNDGVADLVRQPSLSRQ